MAHPHARVVSILIFVNILMLRYGRIYKRGTQVNVSILIFVNILMLQSMNAMRASYMVISFQSLFL